MGESLDNTWPIRKPSANVYVDDELKTGFLKKLLEAQGIDGEITDLSITLTREPTFNFNFRKLLSLKHMKDDLHTRSE